MSISFWRSLKTTPCRRGVPVVEPWGSASGYARASRAPSCRGKGRATLFASLLVLLVSFVGPSIPALAAVMSQQLRDEAGIPVLFEDLLASPREYTGRVVVLGGYILEMQNEPDRRILTVIQAPLDWRERPKSRDLSQGRFFVTTSKFLDPELYVKGRRITVGGRVAGVGKQSVDGATFTFPVIAAQELYLWPKKTHLLGPCYPCWEPWYGARYSWGYCDPWWGSYP
jgi:outer membrane lipoprotein